MPESKSVPSLGLVETCVGEVCPDGLLLESGVSFGPISLAYEVYGEMNVDKDNVILVCHALSGGAHAAGVHVGVKKPGWWDCMIGPGKGFDTDKYCVICVNVPGSCYGSSGPASLDPATGRPYGLNFPVFTVADMARAQMALLDNLGVGQVLCVAGGSMGGMSALQLSVLYPERIRSVIAIATTHRHSPQQIAFNEVARQSIMADPAWNKGDYYDTEGPRLGLAVARMTGHVTYLSERGMELKFGRRLREKLRYGFDFSLDFEVESYLRYQGHSFVERFDANSLLYLTKALDYFDLSSGHESLTDSFRLSGNTLYLLIAFSSDWLYPPQQLKEVARAIRRSGGDATYYEISSDFGHDAFLLDYKKQEPLVTSFLARAHQDLP